MACGDPLSILPQDSATEGARRPRLSRPTFLVSRPTWPVGADLLFERVRSVEYMVLATSLTLLIWLFQLLLTTRVNLGNTSWEWDTEFNLKPLYWLAYADCGADITMNVSDEDISIKSTFGNKPCDASVQSGFVWEILYAALQNLLDMVLLQMVNNPWRSKLWGLPAFAVISLNILDWGKLVFSSADDNFDGELDVLITARKILDGMFASCWIALLFLLARVLWSANFNERRGHESVDYTRRLLRSKANTGAPARFQKYAEALKPVCDEEDLASCAQAALRHKELREEARRAPSEGPTDEPQQGLRGWFDSLLGRCRPSPDHPKESVAQRAVETPSEVKSNPPGDKCDGGEGRSGQVLKSLDRLPSLAQVSMLLSALVVIFAGVYIVFLATESKLIFTAGGAVLNATADTVEELAETVVVSTQGLRNLTWTAVQAAAAPSALLPALGAKLSASQSGLLSAVSSLELLARQLEAANSTEAATSLRQTTATIAALPALDSDEVKSAVEALSSASSALAFVQSLDQGLEGIETQAEAILDKVRRLAEKVRFAVDWVDVLARTTETTLAASACVGMPVAFGIIDCTRRSWRRMRDEVRIGAHRQSQYWEPSLFDPVKAPTLPGLMASSVLLAFVSVVLSLFLVMEGLVMAVHSGWSIPWKALGDMALGSGTMLLVKVLVLDKLARRYLTHNGFVTAWVGFAWFVCFTLPFYALTSVLAAIYRFVVLVGVGFGYVAAVHTTLLPPSLQSLDPGWTASMSMLVLAHRHNSPISFAFSEAFLGDGIGHGIRKTRAQKNWKMAITMVRNPQLADFRVAQEHDDAFDVGIADDFAPARSPCLGSLACFGRRKQSSRIDTE